MNSKLILSLIALFLFTSLQAQNGSLKGKILDSSTKEPLIGASALLQGTTLGAASDLNGEFIITNVAPGTYTVVSSYISYKPFKLAKVVVKAGQETVIDINLESSNITLKEVELVAKFNRESENVLLLQQKQSLLALQAIGSKEMSRKGISNAEAAVAQVSGISKQEGVKNVVVRGLGDRYNNTTLNGFPIPSEDPEYKNISLDFFGSDIIKNIDVNKVFSAGSYSDVGGAQLNIATKELVGDKELSLDLSSGMNSNTVGANLLQMDGSNYFGISNAKHPVDFRSSYNYRNNLNPVEIGSPINHGFGFTLGKKYKVGSEKDPLSFYLIANQNVTNNYTDEKSAEIINNGVYSEKLDGFQSSQNTNQLLLLNLAYLPTKKHEISYNFLLVHDYNQSVGKYKGLIQSGDSYDGALIYQQANDNYLFTNQLITKFKLSTKFTLDAGAAYNRVKGLEPDRKYNAMNEIEPNKYVPFTSESAFVRNFSELIENDMNLKLAVNYQLRSKFKNDASAIKAGVNFRYVTDSFDANEYSYNSRIADVQVLDKISLDSWYNAQNLTAGKFLVANNRHSVYDVNKFINSTYATVDYMFNKDFVLSAGLNFDIVNFEIDYNINNGQEADNNNLKKNYFLPSVNLKYSINDKNTLRFGASKSYTLPQSKEISPYLFIGLTSSKVGNPELQPSDNYNFDVKWDYYISPSELISINAFAKYILNPIASVYKGSAGGYYTYDNISDNALVAGTEIEIRKNLFNLSSSKSEKTNKLSVGLNASYIYSNTEVHDVTTNTSKKRKLEGAAPFLANVDLSYNYSNKDFSWTNSVVLNYFNDRLYSMGMNGFEDVIERSTPKLNFVSTAELNKHFDLKLKVNNILNPEFNLTRMDSNNADHILSSYKKGVDFSIGVSYKF